MGGQGDTGGTHWLEVVVVEVVAVVWGRGKSVVIN